jgi:hypothetical protein
MLSNSLVRKLQVEHLSKSNITFQLDRNGYLQVLTQSILQPNLNKRANTKSKERVKSIPLIDAGVR